MQRCFLVIVALSCVLSSGCTTSTTIKDASTKHASNLTGLQQAVAEYRGKLDDYFDRLIQQQREAHIAMFVKKHIDAIAESQAESIASQMRKESKSEQPAKDFIMAGADIIGVSDSSRETFNLWVEELSGKDLAERQKALEEKAAAIEKMAKDKNPPDADLLEKARKIKTKILNDDELTYVGVAIELKQQRAIFDAQLNVLAAGVTTMQAFHAKINEFLAIDVTIDAARIASAAAAGSKADVTGILGKK